MTAMCVCNVCKEGNENCTYEVSFKSNVRRPGALS